MSRVSVILPTFNRSELIGETLESLLAQTRRPDEIIVVDDGSTDTTSARLAVHADQLHVVRQQNAGKAAALNRALGLVQGDLIWIVDDDDILMPTACAHLAGALEAEPALDFCAGRHLDFTHDPKHGRKETRPPGYMRVSGPEQIFPDLLEGCHIFQPGLMVRRRVYDSVGEFKTDLARSQDYEMLLRIARAHKGRQIDEVVFWHREHEGPRGQAGQRFSAASNADRWAEFNRRIFSDLLSRLADHELFEPKEWAAVPEPARERLARIACATIEARQRMWAEALTDLARAARSGTGPLRIEERTRLARATLSNLGTANLVAEPALHAQLRALGDLGPIGAQMRAILRRSMRWQYRAALRAGDLGQLIRLFRFFRAS